MRRRIAISTILGFVIGIACIIIAINGAGRWQSFVNGPSIFITVGGTLGGVIVSFPPDMLKSLGSVFFRVFKTDSFDLAQDIETIVELSRIARSKGILVLEDAAKEHGEDEFLRKGILLIADGVGEEVLRDALEADIYFTQKRHAKGHAMIDMIASSVTSLGLMGTYIGLIPMLENLEDPASLGPLMALELVTSFYGAFLSYVVFSPMSKKLKVMSNNETLRKELLLEGLIAIQEGQNPRLIQEKLTAGLTKKEASRMGEDGTASGGQSRLRDSLKLKKGVA